MDRQTVRMAMPPADNGKDSGHNKDSVDRATVRGIVTIDHERYEHVDIDVTSYDIAVEFVAELDDGEHEIILWIEQDWVDGLLPVLEG